MIQSIIISACAFCDGKQPIYSEISIGLQIMTTGDEARRTFLGPVAK
jgi:hypothetical protein